MGALAEPSETGIVLTAAQKRRQRQRSLAIAAVLTCLVVLFYAITVVKLGAPLLNRPI